MLRMLILIAVVMFVGLSVQVYAQDSSTRTNALVASLDKTKYKKKEKKNISIEFYLNIKNEAVVRAPADYAGSYDAGNNGSSLSLQVDSRGSASGSGSDTFDRDRRMSFTLKDASISGALLTGTKVYENGEQRPFEGVFVNRTVSTGKNANTIESQETNFGIGFIVNSSSSDESGKIETWTNRIFLMRR